MNAHMYYTLYVYIHVYMSCPTLWDLLLAWKGGSFRACDRGRKKQGGWAKTEELGGLLTFIKQWVQVGREGTNDE